MRLPDDYPLPRRRFLHGASAGLAGPVLASAAAAQEAGGPVAPAARPMPKLEEPMPAPQGERVGFAVVGLGKFALGQILPAFAEAKHARLAALVSGSPEKAREVGRHHGVGEAHLYGYGDLERLADDDVVQVVYVITPNALHEEFVVRAAKAGKHVLCEKPMAPTAVACERMIAACREAGRKLMIAYRAQYEPHNLAAIDLCRNGELGTLKLVTSDHGRQLDPEDPADQWRMRKAVAGGGSLVDIGIYSLNAARYLTGEEPVEVRGMVHSTPGDARFAEVEETCLFQLRFPSGAVASLSSSYGHAEVKRIQVMGTEATLELDPATDYEKHQMWLRTKQEERQLQPKEASQFAAEMDHLAECVLGGQELKTPGEEGLRDVRLMEAIYASAARAGEPVQL
jgi:glucose-fructose oxidoreductase